MSDLGRFATHTTRKRMIGIQRQLKANDKNYRAFEILNLAKYERQHFLNINTDLSSEMQQKQHMEKENKYIDLILGAYSAEKLKNNSLFHGKKGNHMVVVGPVNFPVSRSSVENIISECVKSQITNVDFLAFEFEMGLSPNMQNEAQKKGVSLSLKYIPPEVFDRRAVEKGHVAFYDMSYIDVKIHKKQERKKLIVAVELINFSTFYSQDVKSLENLRVGKSRIVVDQGQVIKINKGKDQMTREVLTRSWKDWVDYWAIDFNYAKKLEFIRVIDGDKSIEKPTGNYIFENEWQSFRTQQDCIEWKSVKKEISGRTKVAVKVIDIFGNDTMKIIEI